jgi:hypothetical protein
LPSAIHRAAVDFDTPQRRAASRTDPPGIAIVVGAFPRPAQSFPLCPGPLQAGLDPLSDPRALELRNGPEDVHLELAELMPRNSTEPGGFRGRLQDFLK